MAAAARLKRNPSFVLASSHRGQGSRHDPLAQRERINLFKRQLAANRTRGSEEAVMRRHNKALSAMRPPGGGAWAQESTNSFVTRSMVSVGVWWWGGVGGGGGGRGLTGQREALIRRHSKALSAVRTPGGGGGAGAQESTNSFVTRSMVSQ